MFCTNCGTARQGESKYCGGCGNLFSPAAQSTPSPTLREPAPAERQSPIVGHQNNSNQTQDDIVDIYYWLLATSPIVIMIFDGILTWAFGPDAGTILGSFAAILLVLVVVSFDSSHIRNFGIRVPFWMGAVLPPLYIFRRAKATGRNQAAFITWLATYGLLVIVTFAGLGSSSSGVATQSYEAGQQAGSAAAQDRFNDLFASIEDSCAAKADYYSWSNYQEFIQGCVDEYRFQTGK